MNKIILDLGCGKVKKEGTIGIDKTKFEGVDIVYDLEKGIPYPDNSVDGIYSGQYIEHCNNFIQLMEEIWRVCKPGAKVELITDYWSSSVQSQDPTHVRPFAPYSLHYFCKDDNRKPFATSEYPFNCNFKIIDIKYTYYKPFTIFKLLPKKLHRWNLARFFTDAIEFIKYELEVVK